MAAKRATTQRRARKAAATAKLPVRIPHRARNAVARVNRRHASALYFGKLIATAGLLIAAAASAAVFVPKPMLRDAKDKLGKNLLPLGNRVAELASRLAEDAETFGRSLRG